MWFRVYIDKAKGGDHARVEDFEADDEQAATAAAEKLIRRGEQLGQVVRIHPEGER